MPRTSTSSPARDPEHSRARILAAAHTEFAEHEFDGARVDRIAALAGIGVTDFAAVEFGGNPDEIGDTRDALKGLLK